MIKFLNQSNDEPFQLLKKTYDQACSSLQKNIEAISISSYNSKEQYVDSRFVNLKVVDNKEFIFFTNYNSPKSNQFISHKQISALFFWNSINTQIRIKAIIKRKSKAFNDSYFSKRPKEKNALAISSNQSKKINSYEDVIKNYEKTVTKDNLIECPSYWGGFSFTPYEMEFWEGHKNRLNKRLHFELVNKKWIKSILEP